MAVGTDATPPALRVALVYDMDACRGPTGVTRHALAQLERLAARPEVRLSVVSGRIAEPDGLAYWERWRATSPAASCRCATRDAAARSGGWLAWPPLELWTGARRLGLLPRPSTSCRPVGPGGP